MIFAKQSCALAAALLLTTAGSAFAQGYSEWDGDGDGALSKQEFTAGLSGRGIFQDWDTNRDTLLNEYELTDGVFGNYDRDEDDAIGQGESDVYVGDLSDGGLWGSSDYGSDFEEWDIDGDGVVARREFGSGFANRGGQISEWDADADGRLSQDEFSSGVFQQYDKDGNDLVEEPELNDLGDDLGDGGFWDV